MNTKRSIVNLGKTYNDCVIEVTLSHLKNISQNYRKLPRNKTLGWAVLGMWHRQPYHLCCLVHVGIIKLWGICLQLFFLLHIKTNCELQQVLCGECVTQNFFFKDTACAVPLSGTIHMPGTCYRESCQVNLDAQVVCVTLVELERIPPFCKFTE